MSATESRHEEVMRAIGVLTAELAKVRTILRKRGEEPQLKTRAEVAKMIGCGERHVSVLVDRGELPEGGMLGRERVWRAEDVNEYLERRLTRRRRR